MNKPRNTAPRKVARIASRRTPKTPPQFEVVQLFPVQHHVTDEYQADLRLNDGVLTHSDTVRVRLPRALAEALLDAGVRAVRK